jgi:hypothetical protein
MTTSTTACGYDRPRLGAPAAGPRALGDPVEDDAQEDEARPAHPMPNRLLCEKPATTS